MKVSTTLISSLVIAIGMAASGATLAWNEGGGEQDEALHLTPNLKNGRDVYEVCAACHLTEGWGTEDGTFPMLAGQHKDVLIKQLSDIRARNRDLDVQCR
jgi:cytochrome c553